MEVVQKYCTSAVRPECRAELMKPARREKIAGVAGLHLPRKTPGACQAGAVVRAGQHRARPNYTVAQKYCRLEARGWKLRLGPVGSDWNRG